MMRRCVVLWFLLLVSGCSTSRSVRLDTGRDTFLVIPREEAGSRPREAELTTDEFKGSLRELARDVRSFRHPTHEARQRFGVPSRGGVYRYEPRGHRLIPQATGDDGPHLLASYADEELTQAYGQWCSRKKQPGDCLRLLDEGPVLASDGKYTLAMAIAMDSVWDETAEALADMTHPQALMATVTSAVSVYLLLWTLPEPVSKGLAALLTATAIAYLGVDTVWRLLDGWLVLVREVDQATTFAQLSTAGETYGEVLGENAARIFVMLATTAIGNTAGLAAKSTRLPGSAQAALNVEVQAGYQFAALGSVKSVAMTAEGFAIALAPHAVAMAARETATSRTQKHHLATNKNEISTARGGPWTPEFRRIFKRAGMELKDPDNIVQVQGHKGPHPRAYHQAVHDRLINATEGCRTMESCRKALTTALKELAEEVSTPGTKLHRLLTRAM